jgi:hypothetical protein
MEAAMKCKFSFAGSIAAACLLFLGAGSLAATPVHCGTFVGQTVCWFANDSPFGTAIESVPSAGQVKVWYKYPSHANPIRIFVSNGRQERYFDMNQPSSGMAMSIDLAQGDTLYVGACDIYYGINPTTFSQCSYRSMGWQERIANWVCRANPNPYNRGSFDFSDLEAAVEAQGLPILSRQCWGDYQEDPTDVDFNDFTLILSYERTFSGLQEGALGVVSDPAACRAFGWLRYDQNLSRDLFYRVLVDGVQQSSGYANQFRSDLTSVCAGGTCAFDVNLWSLLSPNLPHTILVQGQNFMTGDWFTLAQSPQILTCASPATPTPVSLPTHAPTETPLPGPLVLTLIPSHSQLVYFGPQLGQPAQALSGTVHGGDANYQVTIFTRSPSGSVRAYALSSSGNFLLDAESSGDPYLGTSEQGTWSAWAVAQDASGKAATSPTVTWEVNWWPVHGRPV